MKTAETASARHSSQTATTPFFSKEGENSFFADSPVQVQRAAFFGEDKNDEGEGLLTDSGTTEIQQKAIFESDEPAVQMKVSGGGLRLGEPDDKYEKEADEVADQVLENEGASMEEEDFKAEESASRGSTETGTDIQAKTEKVADPSIDSGEIAGNTEPTTVHSPAPEIQAKCKECEKEEEQGEEPEVQRKPIHDEDNVHRPDEFMAGRSWEEEQADKEILFKRMPDIQRSGSGSSGDESSVRGRIEEIARGELGKVEAKRSDGSGKRVGSERLLEYFHLAAPDQWPDEVIENVKYGEGHFPHWCAIFAIYVIKKAGVDVGNWEMGLGVSRHNTLENTDSPQKGDIGYIHKPFRHHSIIIEVNGDTVKSIDGNSGPFSGVLERTRAKSDYTLFMTPFTGREKYVQRKEEAGAAGSESLKDDLDRTSGHGKSLDQSVRFEMEHSIGADFSQVNIHNDIHANTLSQDLHAQAFTHGKDIYFNEGKYNPETSSGKHLLAHELTHTVQQGAASGKKIQKQEEGESTAQEKAEEIYEALNWSNEIIRLFNAMRAPDNHMRSMIRDAFYEEYDEPIQGYLQDQLDSDNLVKAYSLLSESNYHGPHVALALALIPFTTRDEEVFRLLEGRELAQRKSLEERYNYVFGKDGWKGGSYIGEGSLRDDLIDDLSFDDEEKALMLLHRDLHESDHLYLDSRGISGTRTDKVVNSLQRVWRQGPEAFNEFVEKWNENIKNNAGNWRDGALNETLREAMDAELSGEEWEQAKAVLDAFDRYKEKGLLQSDLGEGPPTEEQKFLMEEIQLDEANAALTAATTGGMTGAGTDEEQVFSAIERINQVWTERIARVTNPLNEELKNHYERQWETRRLELIRFLPNEMDEDTVDYAKTRLLLEGNLTLADKIYLADLDFNYDQINALVREAWAAGQVSEVSSQAREARTSSADGEIIRPSYDLMLTIPATRGDTAAELYILTNREFSQTRRGANLIDHYLSNGTSNSDLLKAHDLLKTKGISSELRNNTLESYVDTFINDQEGESKTQKFLNYIGHRYEHSATVWDFHDLLAPAQSVEELLRRARGRRTAENTGVLNAVLNGFVHDYDELSGEDTMATVDESINRLEYYAERTNVTTEELQGMLELAGITYDPDNPQAGILELAQLEYRDFNSRLQSLRAIKQTIAEAIATAVELVVEAAITIATGGAGGAALVASISAAVAGMLVREALLGNNYDLVSSQNLQQLIVTIASHGFGQMGNRAFNEFFDPDTIERLGRLGHFLEGSAEGLGSQIGQQMTSAAFNDRMPTTEQLAAGVANLVVSGVSSGTSSAISNSIRQNPTGMERLRNSLASSLADSMIGGLGEEGVNIAASGDSNQTPWDIGLRLGRKAASSFGQGMVSGLGDAGAQLNSERQRQREAEGRPETDFDEMLNEQLGEVDSPMPGDENATPDTVPADRTEARDQVDQLTEQVGNMNVELQTLLIADNELRARVIDNQMINNNNVEAWNEIAILSPMHPDTYDVLLNNAGLRRALIDNPAAARALKHCASPCFPANATAANILALESLIRQRRENGDPVDMRMINEFLYQQRDAENLDEAIRRLQDNLDGALENLSIESYDEITIPDDWNPPASFERARAQLEAANIPFDLLQRLINRGALLDNPDTFFQNINLMMRRDSTSAGMILHGLAGNDSSIFNAAMMLAGRLAAGREYTNRVDQLLAQFSLSQLADGLAYLKEARPELSDGWMFNWFERAAEKVGTDLVVYDDASDIQDHPGEGFGERERGTAPIPNVDLIGLIGEYEMMLAELQVLMPDATDEMRRHVADQLMATVLFPDRQRPPEVDALIGQFKEGRISMDEMTASEDFPAEGVLQVSIAVGTSDTRIIDHLFRRGGQTVFRENKNVQNLTPDHGISHQVDKDIQLLLSHSNSIVEWNITGTASNEYLAYVRDEAMRLGVADRFIIRDKNGTTTASDIPNDL